VGGGQGGHSCWLTGRRAGGERAAEGRHQGTDGHAGPGDQVTAGSLACPDGIAGRVARGSAALAVLHRFRFGWGGSAQRKASCDLSYHAGVAPRRREGKKVRRK